MSLLNRTIVLIRAVGHLTLHSTMSLLNLISVATVCLNKCFTFHNVSIKSGVNHTALTAFYTSLHSTMSLLNPMPRLPFIANSVFTFHNVSIKSRFSSLFKTNDFTFTFHDVSIKSIERYERNARRIPLHSTMFLLNHDHSAGQPAVHVTLHSTMFLLNRGGKQQSER